MYRFILLTIFAGLVHQTGFAQANLTWPPELPGGVSTVSESSAKLLKPSGELKPGVKIATAVPTIDFLYFDCQTYPGKPWSVWGDGLAVGDRYYTSIGDHLAPRGNAFVYEYDSTKKTLRLLSDIRSIIKVPEPNYTPGKIHSRLTLGDDGWLYFSTHRGSTRATVPENGFSGSWILRCHPEDGRGEVVAHAPLPNQCLPTGELDPARRIFYAGTADGDHKNKDIKFLAYDVAKNRVLYSDDRGPYRAMIFAPSTGRVYFQREASRGVASPLVRFDPETPGKPEAIAAELGLRAATRESRSGKVYTVDGDHLWEFDTKTETARELGGLTVAEEDYITSIDLDPFTERYLYFIAGSHGGSYKDGAPLVQYDLKNGGRKVIAFLHPSCEERTGFTTMGSYATAVSPQGDKVYITWHGNRGGMDAKRKKLSFNTCALTVVHIPASERED
ncbi:MAG: hypothetical protein ACI9UA_003650 [Pseudoalteromonas tetraodonis]|jgi:hypothetical protein